jgi:hypothetical protein
MRKGGHETNFPGARFVDGYVDISSLSADGLFRGGCGGYVAAFRDLNGDGVDEAVVYLLGSNWCGSGGCNMLVLRQEHGSWKVVSTMTIVRPPVRVLESTSNGWRDIGVWVQGGGIRRGYEAELHFNGKTYSRNPSVPPAKHADQGASGETVIAVPLQSKPLRGT